jgi:hypothetical protein
MHCVAAEWARRIAGEVTGRQDLRAEVDVCGLSGVLHGNVHFMLDFDQNLIKFL